MTTPLSPDACVAIVRTLQELTGYDIVPIKAIDVTPSGGLRLSFVVGEDELISVDVPKEGVKDDFKIKLAVAKLAEIAAAHDVISASVENTKALALN